MRAKGTRETAMRLITERCLIAADIDKTVLDQGSDEERRLFHTKIAPALVHTAALGVNVAFLTGNSMNELGSRMLKWLLDELCHTDQISLLDRFHFFCNAGGVYSHFTFEDDLLRKNILESPKGEVDAETILNALTISLTNDGYIAIHPRFIDSACINRCRIHETEAGEIRSVLENAALRYHEDVKNYQPKYERFYDFSKAFESGNIIKPYVEMRWIEYGPETKRKRATVQITLKPVLSFRQARDECRDRLFGKDLRHRLITSIQKELDKRGLGHYIARPGGRTSIDVTLEKLDKAYALEFLIDHLNLRGHARRGQLFGSNTIYLGDEVIVGGGNDYPVTRIPGLLVMAVNGDKDFIPFASNIFVPSQTLVGPEATYDVLQHFNRTAERLLHEFRNPGMKRRRRHFRNAVEAFKQDLFETRIKKKIENLKVTSANELQTIHAFVTLMCRNDPAARKWMSILVNELDEIMTQLASNPNSGQAALGARYEEIS